MTADPQQAADIPSKPVRRLCNEIQLFDLCDQERCRHKEGLFCTDQDLLSRFESIADIEDRPVEARICDEDDEDDGFDEGYEDGFEDDFDEDGLEEDH
jgi:hypothetical protein